MLSAPGFCGVPGVGNPKRDMNRSQRQFRRRPKAKKKTRTFGAAVRCVVFTVVVVWVALLALYAQPLDLTVDPIPIEEAAAIEKERRDEESSDRVVAVPDDVEKAAANAGLVAAEKTNDDTKLPPPEDEFENEEPGVDAKEETKEEEERESFVMERDERTGLYVPEFWKGETTMQTIDGEPTIFLMIASYRDFQCRDSIASALERARFPKRVKVGAVQQNRETDIGCAEPEVPCAEKPEQTLCKYKDQIRVFDMDARDATGPVYARHIGYRMYRGEAFALQIDAHCVFVNNWDEDILMQWRATRNDMAVLSTYLTDVQGSVTPRGDSTRRTRPIMCNSDFEGRPPARYLRHNSQPEAVPVIQDEPMLQPFWAAGFSFARGHFLVKVKYDCCLPMVFMGEEISIGIRAWTHGYDMYAPQRSVVFHEYAQNSKRRATVPKFWESNRKNGDGVKSLKRLTALIGMAPDVLDYDTKDADIYGLGKKRDVQKFYDLFLVDVRKKTAQPLCKLVEGGALHRHVHSEHLKPDGIDYDNVDLDTQAFLDEHLYTPVANRLRRAIDRQDHNLLTQLLNEANRVKLDRRSDTLSDLVKQARQLQSQLIQQQGAKSPS